MLGQTQKGGGEAHQSPEAGVKTFIYFKIIRSSTTRQQLYMGYAIQSIGVLYPSAQLDRNMPSCIPEGIRYGVCVSRNT